MADLVVVDEPNAQRHRVAGFALDPDRHRPRWLDERVVVARCGMAIALVGLPAHRPAHPTSCPGCFGG